MSKTQEKKVKATIHNYYDIDTNFSQQIDCKNDFPAIPFLPKQVEAPPQKTAEEKLVQYNGGEQDAQYGLPQIVDRTQFLPQTFMNTPRYRWPLTGEQKILEAEDAEILSQDIIEEERLRRVYKTQILPTKKENNENIINDDNKVSTSFLYKPEYSEDTILSQDEKKRQREVGEEHAKRRKQEYEKHTEKLVQDFYSKEPKERIEDSFNAMLKEPIHPTDPNLIPLQIYPQLPDLNILYNPSYHSNTRKQCDIGTYTQKIPDNILKELQDASIISQKEIDDTLSTSNNDNSIDVDTIQKNLFTHKNHAKVDSKNNRNLNNRLERIKTFLIEYTKQNDITNSDTLDDEAIKTIHDKVLLLLNKQDIRDDIINEDIDISSSDENDTNDDKDNYFFGQYNPIHEENDTHLYEWNSKQVVVPSRNLHKDNNFYVVLNDTEALYGRIDHRISLKKSIPLQNQRDARYIRCAPSMLDLRYITAQSSKDE